MVLDGEVVESLGFPPFPARCAGGDPAPSWERQGAAPVPLPCSEQEKGCVCALQTCPGLWERSLLAVEKLGTVLCLLK